VANPNPTVDYIDYLWTLNTGPTVITNFVTNLDPIPAGKRLIVHFRDTFTTITNNANIILKNGRSSYTGALNDVLEFVHFKSGGADLWVQAGQEDLYPETFQTLTADTNQVTVSLSRNYQTANTVPTNLDDILGGTDGQHITIVVRDGNTTIRDFGGASGNIRLDGSADYSTGINDTLSLIYHATPGLWIETGRGDQ
jgi:hypothetical protein